MGYSSDGIVIACDVSEDFTNIARKFWAEAGVEHKVQLKLAPAADTLSQLVEAGEENTFDFAFIDADKVAADRLNLSIFLCTDECCKLSRPVTTRTTSCA